MKSGDLPCVLGRVVLVIDEMGDMGNTVNPKIWIQVLNEECRVGHYMKSLGKKVGDA